MRRRDGPGPLARTPTRKLVRPDFFEPDGDGRVKSTWRDTPPPPHQNLHDYRISRSLLIQRKIAPKNSSDPNLLFDRKRAEPHRLQFVLVDCCFSGLGEPLDACATCPSNIHLSGDPSPLLNADFVYNPTLCIKSLRSPNLIGIGPVEEYRKVEGLFSFCHLPAVTRRTIWDEFQDVVSWLTTALVRPCSSNFRNRRKDLLTRVRARCPSVRPRT